jgi:hypothetical protein
LAHGLEVKGRHAYVNDVVEYRTAKNRILRVDLETMESLVLLTKIRDGKLLVDDTHVDYSPYTGGVYRIAR